MVVLETSIFTRQLRELLTDDDLMPNQLRILRKIIEEEYP